MRNWPNRVGKSASATFCSIKPTIIVDWRASPMPIAEASLVTLLVKLGVVASLASILTRFSGAKRMLLREQRTLNQRLRFALWFAAIFGAGVLTRVATVSYLAVDLGLEGSLLAGIL